MAGAQDESIAAAAASVSAAQATLSDAQAALDQLTLRAPFAGTVAAVNAEVGEQVSPGLKRRNTGGFLRLASGNRRSDRVGRSECSAW